MDKNQELNVNLDNTINREKKIKSNIIEFDFKNIILNF
jgi:hypothetical protein